jgi:methionine-rich copper-binding protein CopC
MIDRETMTVATLRPVAAFAPFALIALLAAFVLRLAAPAPAAAHTELTSAVPADGSTLTSVPAEVVLRFSGELDPDLSTFTVTAPGGVRAGSGEVDLGVAERNLLRGSVSGSAAGTWTVHWTAASIDGHVSEGDVAFTVAGPAPDTAVRPPPGALVPIGVALVAGGLAVAMRRRRPVAPVALGLALVLGACVNDNRPATCDDPSVSIDLSLTATSLTPNNPSACRDQDVTFVVASDADGVLHLHGYDEAVPATSVTSGGEVTLQFEAIRSGQFPIEFHPASGGEGVEIGIFSVYEP